ncbi:hypothetical protein QCA50_007800 [Cerrena zonata]|uniref:Uncharacterized protein n=1 Tax=Cerrena zonata TaxID=2478898 RepID=A0AAW0GH40_9APHY
MIALYFYKLLDDSIPSPPSTIMSPPLPTAANILGGFLIEVSLTLFLYGIVTAQSYIYVFNSKDDHVVLKLVVATVWALESIHSALTIHIMYAYAIVDFGKLAELGFIVWSIGVSNITTYV